MLSTSFREGQVSNDLTGGFPVASKPYCDDYDYASDSDMEDDDDMAESDPTTFAEGHVDNSTDNKSKVKLSYNPRFMHRLTSIFISEQHDRQ